MNKNLFFASFVLGLFLINFIHASEIISDSEVKYDSEVFEILKSSKWAPIIVEVKDITNVSVSYKDSVEVQEAKDKERKIILENITDSILSTLSKDEFILKRKSLLGDGFSGNITKEGFEKLLTNPNVKKVYFSGTSYMVTTARIKNIFADIIKIIFVMSIILIIYRLIKNKIHKKNKK